MTWRPRGTTKSCAQFEMYMNMQRMWLWRPNTGQSQTIWVWELAVHLSTLGLWKHKLAQTISHRSSYSWHHLINITSEQTTHTAHGQGRTGWHRTLTAHKRQILADHTRRTWTGTAHHCATFNISVYMIVHVDPLCCWHPWNMQKLLTNPFLAAPPIVWR